MKSIDSEYQRQYRQKNKEKIRVYQKEYREKNKAKLKEYQKEYRKMYRQLNVT